MYNNYQKIYVQIEQVFEITSVFFEQAEYEEIVYLPF